MDFLTEWWGVEDNISPLEVIGRGAAMFVIMLILLRFTGMRSFSKGSVFDNVIIILLGAVLGRGVVGGTPFFSALIGGIVLLLIPKFISRLTFYNKWAGRHIKGNAVLLYKEGKFLYERMKECDITEHDIYEELRLSIHKKEMDVVDEVYMERSGKISFILKGKIEVSSGNE
ncbi:MAG TPA: YetF domain-containing protein [Flavisolibacter sp.]